MLHTTQLMITGCGEETQKLSFHITTSWTNKRIGLKTSTTASTPQEKGLLCTDIKVIITFQGQRLKDLLRNSNKVSGNAFTKKCQISL